MSLIGIILTLIVVGVVLWAINSFIPMDATIRKLLTGVVLLVVVLWLLQGFGLLQSLGTVRVR